jgi:hypothetical protein
MTFRRVLIRLVIASAIVCVAIVVTDILVHGDVNLAKELIPIVIPAAIAATMADLIMGDVDRPPRKK